MDATQLEFGQLLNLIGLKKWL